MTHDYLWDKSGPPDPEVAEKARRRKFSAEYKLRVLRLADSCTDPGSLGRLLRKEGLYSSNLTTWRRQRDQGILQGLKPAKRGRKPSEPNPLLPELEQLRKESKLPPTLSVAFKSRDNDS